MVRFIMACFCFSSNSDETGVFCSKDALLFIFFRRGNNKNNTGKDYRDADHLNRRIAKQRARNDEAAIVVYESKPRYDYEAHRIVEGSENYDHPWFPNVHLSLSTRASSISRPSKCGLHGWYGTM